MAQHNHLLQLFATPAEVGLPCQSSLTCWSLPFACPRASEAAGTPTSTAPSLQPSSDSSRDNNGALSHRQGERKDRDTGPAHCMDVASWTGKPLGRGVPVHTPAALPDSSPLPSTNWHVLVCKGRFWAGGTDGRTGISVQ